MEIQHVLFRYSLCQLFGHENVFAHLNRWDFVRSLYKIASLPLLLDHFYGIFSSHLTPLSRHLLRYCDSRRFECRGRWSCHASVIATFCFSNNKKDHKRRENLGHCWPKIATQSLIRKWFNSWLHISKKGKNKYNDVARGGGGGWKLGCFWPRLW